MDGARGCAAGAGDGVSGAGARGGVGGGGQPGRSGGGAGSTGEEWVCQAGLCDPDDRGGGVQAGGGFGGQRQSSGHPELPGGGLDVAAGVSAGEDRSGPVCGHWGERSVYFEVRETGVEDPFAIDPALSGIGVHHISFRRALTSKAASPPSSVRLSAAIREPWKVPGSRFFTTLSVRKRLRPP